MELIPSDRSVKTFWIINSFLSILGLGYYQVYTTTDLNYLLYLLLNYIYLLSRNYFLLDFLESKVKNVALINKDTKPEEKYQHEFDYHLVIDTMIELLAISLLKPAESTSFLMDILWFIPKTFLFEFIFDFFHYWMHRLCHQKSLYFLHKKHHSHKYPRGITVFYQDPADLFLTNLIPTYLTFSLVPLSKLQMSIFLMYKTYIEIAGHLGRRFYPTSSFPQFIWLPKLLNIELYTEDHDLHHTHFKYNFSKRFIVWDKLFGTYKKPKLIKKDELKTEDEPEIDEEPWGKNILNYLNDNKRMWLAATAMSLCCLVQYVI